MTAQEEKEFWEGPPQGEFHQLSRLYIQELRENRRLRDENYRLRAAVAGLRYSHDFAHAMDQPGPD